MKALVFEGKNKIAVRDVRQPRAKEHEALVKVSFGGICGTDMHVFHGVHPRAQAPLILGHEFAGEVVDIRGESDIKNGQRVVIEPLLFCGKCHACRQGDYHVCSSLGLIGLDRDGGFSEYVAVPIRALHKIPQQMEQKLAALVEPVAVAVHSVRLSRLKGGDEVVVLGAGTIGVLVAEVARAFGAGKVIVTDIDPKRLDFMRQRGFVVVEPSPRVVEQIDEMTNKKGCDVLYDCAGVQQSAELATRMVKIKGEIVIVAIFNSPIAVDYRSVNFRELSIIGVRVYNFVDYKIAIDMIANKQIDVTDIVSNILPLVDGEQGFAQMEKRDGLKILLQM